MNEQSLSREEWITALCGLAPWTKVDAMLVKSPGPSPCPLLAIILVFICVSSLVLCWLLFYDPYLILVLVHGPGILKLLELTFFDRPWDHSGKATQETSGSGLSAKKLKHPFRGWKFHQFLASPSGERGRLWDRDQWAMATNLIKVVLYWKPP